MMNYEKSCGFVAYREVQGVIHYLIIRSRNGDYGFPKGHMERGETERETAIRELKEETNLEVQITDGFRAEIAYRLPNRKNTIKQAVYFLGRCVTDALRCQETEVSEALFLPFEKAMELLSFENTKAVLKDADAFLHSARCV